ncbi:MAG: helix-turn-helix domain-containing protein [Patescibacteria group bacterium]
MDNIKEFLGSVGLNDKEVAVYLGCLMQGEGTVLQIAKQAKVKRPTAYLILEELTKRGLVLSRKDRKSIKYSPANPKKIVTKLKNSLEQADELMPEILSLYRNDEEKPSVAIYEDMEGYQYTGDIVWGEAKKGKELLVIGNPEFFFKTATDASDKWFSLIKNKKYRARILLFGTHQLLDNYIKRTEAAGNPNIKIKVIKETTHPVVTEEAIVDDIVVLFTGGQKYNSLVIHSRNLADTQREFFERLWSQAE